MKHQVKKSLASFSLEFLVYGILVAVYYLAVLHLLGDQLKDLYDHNRRLYAGASLGLIVGQGLLLEVLTRTLLAWIKPQGEDG